MLTGHGGDRVVGARSPIFSHFGETLEGVSTIRAFRVQPHFVQDNEHRVDYNLQARHTPPPPPDLSRIPL